MMQLNALSNYLQNQPLANNATPETQAADALAAERSVVEAGSYNPSQRAILISAVASEFDVRQLQSQDVSRLQQKLQNYGLLQGSDISGFAPLHNARSLLQDSEKLNALDLLNGMKQRFETDQISYSQRQQINQTHTLIENLASARMTLTPQ